MHAPRFILGLCAALLSCAAFAADVPRPNLLTKAQQATLRESIIPAHQAGDPAAVLAALSPFVARMSEAHQRAADDLLAEEGVPPLAELLIGNRLALIEQNRVKGLPQPQARELLLTLQGLKDRIDAVLAERKTHSAFADSQPGVFAEYEKRLWDMHVMANRLENSARLVRYGQQLLAASKKINAKSLTDADRTLLSTDFTSLYGNLVDMNHELAERTYETRVQRVIYADDVLTNSKDIKERFQAAFWLDLDGEELATFFERVQRSQSKPDEAPAAPDAPTQPARKTQASPDDAGAEFVSAAGAAVKFRQSLADPKLPETIRQHVTHGLQVAGKDFVQKSRLLFTGLHWWFRGRYGMGTDGNGLLKSKLALTVPAAQFGLYMPAETPKPTDPRQAGKQVPQVDRRHHYLWQFETRTIQTAFKVGTDLTTSSTGRVNQITTFDRFY